MHVLTDMVNSRFIKNAIKAAIPNRWVTYRLPRALSGSILLTFDDGPDPAVTPMVLDRLKRNNARAVFFVVGQKAREFPHLLRMIADEGHVIGNHTHTHPNRRIASASELWRELTLCREIVSNLTGYVPKLIRPPLGILSLNMLRISNKLRSRIVLWSVESGEWGTHKNDDADTIISRLEKELQGRDIVLMHDNNEKVVQLLDCILPFLRIKGTDLTNGAKALLS